MIEEYQDTTSRTWNEYQQLPYGPGHIGGYNYVLDINEKEFISVDIRFPNYLSGELQGKIKKVVLSTFTRID